MNPVSVAALHSILGIQIFDQIYVVSCSIDSINLGGVLCFRELRISLMLR